MDLMINKLNVELNVENIKSKYEFVLIKSDSDFSPSRKILDSAEFSKDILAIQYTLHNSLIVMLKKNNKNKPLINQFIKKYNKENGDSLKPKILSVPFEKYPHSMIQVMLNALGKSNKNDDVSNLGGKFYYFQGKSKSQVFCVQIQIKPDYLIDLKGVTFTKVGETDKEYREKQYSLMSNNTMKIRLDKTDKGPFYVKKQYPGVKHEIEFFSNNKNTFYKSKIGILNKVLKLFNSKYKGLCKLSIATSQGWDEPIKSSSFDTKKNQHANFLNKQLEGRSIRIVNGITDDININSSIKFCENLKEAIESNLIKRLSAKDKKLRFEIKISDELNKNDLNLYVIHNRDFCKDNNIVDPHKNRNDMVVQHVTLEDFCTGNNLTKPKEKLSVFLLDLLIIKNDLLFSHKISLLDWSSYHFVGDYIFCDCKRIKLNNRLSNQKIYENHYTFMKIHPDGTFEISKLEKGEYGFIDKDTFDKVDSIFEDKAKTGHNGLVINDKNEINIILDTDYEMYPNINLMEKEVLKGTNIRAVDIVNQLYLGTIDIQYKEQENEAYYSVGEISRGMKGPLVRATKIKKIIPYGTSSLFYRQLLETMNVTFIRYGQLTVMPFPFKYIKEFEMLV